MTDTSKFYSTPLSYLSFCFVQQYARLVLNPYSFANK